MSPEEYAVLCIFADAGQARFMKYTRKFDEFYSDNTEDDDGAEMTDLESKYFFASYEATARDLEDRDFTDAEIYRALAELSAGPEYAGDFSD